MTIELNEAGKVIDIHCFTVEMSFDEHPRTTPGHVIQVNGAVTKIQSGLIYVKTPAGQYTISAKTAPSDAAVGDEVSLWLNDENMVMDHHGKEKHMKGAHRLIFGKLIYTGTTKNQIKLSTPEGENVFPLERMEVKTKPIAEGSQIVVELNEEGAVIDLRKAQCRRPIVEHIGDRGHRQTDDGPGTCAAESAGGVGKMPFNAEWLPRFTMDCRQQWV